MDFEERMAEPAARGDWNGALTPACNMSEDIRQELAAHWTKVGLMEHASVAAFARFAMQLLALGAPPSLLEQTHTAMADETRHAKMCFAMASAYAGRDIGPGALSIEGALADEDPRDILRMVVREGCIGETVAAVEAAEAATYAGDPVVRAALEQIAADEQRHADLAWRFVAWAIDQDARLASALISEIRAARLESEDRLTINDAERGMLQHGVVSDAMRQSIRRHVIAEVIAPAAAQLTRVARAA